MTATSEPTAATDDAIADHVARVVAAWPPLTPAQREAVSALLWPTPSAHGTEVA